MKSLIKANEYFKLGLYEKALNEYISYTKKSNSSDTKVDVSFNINLCQRRLLETKVHNSLETPKTKPISINHDTIFDLPTRFGQMDYDLLKEQEIFIVFFEKIKNSNFDSIEPNEILNILKFSPFQISLLLLAAYVFDKHKEKNKLFEISEKSLNLATLIRSVIDYKFWLDHKKDILARINTLGVSQNGKFLGDKFRAFPLETISNYQNVIQAIKNIDYSNGHKNEQQYNNNQLSIGSILLNEAKFISLNLLNHYNICDEWVLVEGACQGYPTRKVTKDGLSLDNSALQIMLFPDSSNKIRFIQYGWTKQTGEDAKSELRNQYLKYVTGEILLVLDIDEFYAQADINSTIKKFKDDRELTAFTLPQVHFWKNKTQFITGGYYDISHTRFFRNIFGMKYISNHNFPEINGLMLNKINHKKELRVIKELKNGLFKYEGPRCYHMGFSKDEDDMRDKTDYYVNRGEAITRKNTTDSRAGWFDDKLPEECKIRKWGGGLPQVLKKKS